MDSLIKHHITKVFYNLYHSRQQLKFDISLYLDDIYNILKTGISWRAFCCINKSPFHYTTLFKFYKKLCQLDVFNIVYKRFLKNYRQVKLESLSFDEYENLFIDSTIIKNINGKDVIGRNHYDRCRMATKLNVIIDSNFIPIGHIVVASNKNDALLTIPTLATIDHLHTRTNLIADKGYINEKLRKRLVQSKIRLVYDFRRNQKRKINSHKRKLLKKRYCTEHFFSHFKSSYRRIRNRYDSTVASFNNFILLGFISVISKVFYKG
jgi:hypothetical protein